MCLSQLAKSKWLAALRSGSFHQSKRVLYSLYSDSYCCIGVYFKVVKGWKPMETEGQCFLELDYDDNEAWIKAMEKDGLTKGEVQHLAMMNDSGSSFLEIADWIEKNL